MSAEVESHVWRGVRFAIVRVERYPPGSPFRYQLTWGEWPTGVYPRRTKYGAKCNARTVYALRKALFHFLGWRP